MVSQNYFQVIKKTKQTRIKSHLKLREKYKWLVFTRLERLTKDFLDVKQILCIGLEGFRKELKDMTEIIDKGLCSIDQHFATFETPIEKAAEKIARSFENFDKSKNLLGKELREEYHAELRKLVHELHSYAGQLVETNTVQIERSEKLKSSIYDLSKLSVLLNDTLKIFGAIVLKRDKKHTDKEENQKNEELIFGFSEELLKEFTGQYKSSNENFERLLKSVTGSLAQVSEHINYQSEINRVLLRCMGKLSENINSMSESFKEWVKVVQAEESKEKKEKTSTNGAEELHEESTTKIDSLIELLSEGFQSLKDQNELLVKHISIMSDHFPLRPKPRSIKKDLITNSL